MNGAHINEGIDVTDNGALTMLKTKKEPYTFV